MIRWRWQLLVNSLLFIQNSFAFSLMLDPAGDAKNSGRMLNDNFERGITLQCTEQLKKILEAAIPDLRVILTRFPGESIEPLQNANFANRLEVDLYVSIHFYQEQETKPHLYIYYVSYNDTFITKTYDLCLYPYDQAHRINGQKTRNLVTTLKNSLSEKKYARLYDLKGCFGLPFKPLIGIKAPSIAIEISLKKSADWHTCVQPIANGIANMIEAYDA